MRWLKYILTVLCIVCVTDTYSATPSWELITAYRPASDSEDSEKVDVTVRDGYIYVYTPEATTVKVLSIVGQLISQQNIKPGLSRLKVSSRGIYILKVGTVTRRVTV